MAMNDHHTDPTTLPHFATFGHDTYRITECDGPGATTHTVHIGHHLVGYLAARNDQIDVVPEEGDCAPLTGFQTAGAAIEQLDRYRRCGVWGTGVELAPAPALPADKDDREAIARVLGAEPESALYAPAAGADTYHASLVSHLAVYAREVLDAKARRAHYSLDGTESGRRKRLHWDAQRALAQAKFDAVWSVLGDCAD